ncbi:hypothetical protein AAFF_G00063980 [Aldrovandia affinis]|uniref:Uncharacterized protein n=1 Tax=Aldrovandia affinis TaxID=143900 RepID=A0AAD7T417_9TELE|nr:hypothetical protein AAFF_G00063980 [Aldrovandia affinis]
MYKPSSVTTTSHRRDEKTEASRHCRNGLYAVARPPCFKQARKSANYFKVNFMFQREEMARSPRLSPQGRSTRRKVCNAPGVSEGKGKKKGILLPCSA